MPFIDFEELKRSVNYADAVRLLGLQAKQAGNQWRGPCPACRTGGDRALVVTEGRGYYCFAEKKGGDQLALIAHVRGCSVKEAAQELAERNCTVPSTVRSTVPESERSKGTQKPQLQSYFDKLETDHPAVDAVGFSQEFATKHRIGFAKSGILAGTVAIPFRDENGELLGFIGLLDCKLPADFTPNVVPFGKKSA